MSQNKMPPDQYSQMIKHLTRRKIQNPFIPDSAIERPKRILEIEAFKDFNKRNPQMAEGGRIGFSNGTTKRFYDESTGHIYPRTNRFGTVYSDTPAGGSRRNIIPDNIGKKILKEYKDGAGTIELGKKYGVSRETVNRYIKKFNPKLLRESPPKVNQYNFDYNVIDEIREDAKNMSRKQILKKYENKISDTKLDKLVKSGEVKFGIVEEAGRPRVPPGSIPEGTVKRTNRIRNSQGFAISGTKAKNFHHIFPIGGLVDLSPKDVMILDKNINERLGGFNLRLNDIADEIGSMDLSSPNALKKLNDLNAESKQIVDKAKAGLPKRLKNIIGYVEYTPVFDSNGTIVELSQIRKGVDENPSQLAKFGDKKFKNFSTEEKQNFKKEVLRVAKETEKRRGEAGFIDRKLLTGTGKFLGRAAQAGFLTPIGVAATTAGFGGLDLTTPSGRLTAAGIGAGAPELVKASIGATKGIQNRALQKGIQQFLNLGLPTRLALRAARVASPIGIASLVGEGLYQGGKFAKQRFEELAAMSPEQRQELRSEGARQAFDPFQAAGGGLAKQAGDRSGRPPERGPNSQGLLSLMKRGMKI